MCRFYYLQNKTPIIITNLANFFPEALGENGETYNYSEELNEFKKLFLTSFNLIYKDNNALTLGVTIDENALEKFYENGGIFTEKELKELKFERLKDNDFVLNKKPPSS